jgi:hypothetical protein
MSASPRVPWLRLVLKLLLVLQLLLLYMQFL